MSESRLGAVLAGGRSRRMGRDKALLEVGGGTLVARAVARLAARLGEVVVVGGVAPAGWEPAVPWIPDDRPGLGPLGGVSTALRRAAGDVFVLACDLPRVDDEIVSRLLAAAPDFGHRGPEARLAAEGGRVQPLCGLYSASCREPVEASIEAGALAVHAALEGIRVEAVALAVEVAGGRLFNVNRPSDYRELLSMEAGDVD